MNIKEFWESDEKLAIHCDTEKKAKRLLKKFDELGYRWINGIKYTKRNEWEMFENNTCYSNDGHFCFKTFFLEDGYTIIEFEELEEFQPECKTLEFENIKDCESKKYDELIGMINQYVPSEHQEEVIEALDDLIDEMEK